MHRGTIRGKEKKPIENISNNGTKKFNTPSRGKLDWILVLDDASKKYPAPDSGRNNMRLGITSYTYTWAIGVPGSMPEKPMQVYGLIDKAFAWDISLVQIADNLPLEKLTLQNFNR